MTTPHTDRKDGRKSAGMLRKPAQARGRMVPKMTANDQTAGVAFVTVSCEKTKGLFSNLATPSLHAQPVSDPGFINDYDRLSGFRRLDISGQHALRL
jgi:hypothetical protein